MSVSEAESSRSYHRRAEDVEKDHFRVHATKLLWMCRKLVAAKEVFMLNTANGDVEEVCFK